MKNVFLIILISLPFLLFSQAKVKKSDAALAGLHGKVESVKTESFAIVEDSIMVKKMKTIELNWYLEVDNFEKYDREGFLLEKYWYRDDGSINGKLINEGKEDVFYNSDGEAEQKSIKKYNKRGDLIEWKIISKGEYEQKTTYKYKKGKLNRSYFFEKGEKNRIDIFGNNEKVKEVRYRSHNNRGFYKNYTYEYDTIENREKRIGYDLDGEIEYIHSYKYDDKGDMILMNVCDSDNRIIGTEHYIYEYDEFDNWVKKVEYRNDKPKFITEREIIYYK